MDPLMNPDEDLDMLRKRYMLRQQAQQLSDAEGGSSPLADALVGALGGFGQALQGKDGGAFVNDLYKTREIQKENKLKLRALEDDKMNERLTKLAQIRDQEKNRTEDKAWREKVHGDEMGIKNKAQALAEEKANSEKNQFKDLPIENQKMVEKLATDNATKLAIANQIDATVQALESPQITPEQKLMQARQMIKVLNSTQGQDAVGSEEAKRLAGLLEFRKFNFTEPGPFIGRAPIEDFSMQAKLTSRGLKEAIDTNQGQITTLKGGDSFKVTVPSLQSVATKPLKTPARGGGIVNTAQADSGPSPKIMEKAAAAKMAPADFVKATAQANGIDEATAERLLEMY